MKAFVARLNAQQEHPREVVGFFVAESRSRLYRLIDESVDLEACEILELGSGGISWGSVIDMVVPYPEHALEDMPEFPAGASVSESWIGVFAGEGAADWHQTNWDDLETLPDFGEDD